MNRQLHIFACLAAAACGGTSQVPPAPAGTCGQQTGTTSCRGVTCQPGNYCTNATFISKYCQPGCTSDANCGAADFCARCAGDSVGTCQRCGTTPACGQGAHCRPDNVASAECTREGLGAAGYLCSNSDRPVGQCQASSADPNIFCCGATAATCTSTPSSNRCDNAWSRFMGRPGEYSRAFTCSGSAMPTGTCRHLVDDTWCCS